MPTPDQHDDEPDDELDDDDGKYRDPALVYDRVAPSPLPPMGPDGGPLGTGGVGPPPPLPAATPDHFVCLRGPCLHYWQMETHMDAGNPAETWGEDGLRDDEGKPVRQPRQISRTCLVHPGVEVELTENVVYACSRWEPQLPGDLKRRDKRRRVYLKQYPHHAPEALR